MNLYKGNDSASKRNAQVPIFYDRPLSGDKERGLRMALVRRLLGAFQGVEMPAPVLAKRLGKDKKQVYRYEKGVDRPPPQLVDDLVAMCLAADLPITPEWIERGRGELPPLIVPPSVLVPAPEIVEPEKKQTRKGAIKIPEKPALPSVKKTAVNKARGGR
jgi:hypothetical protein